MPKRSSLFGRYRSEARRARTERELRRAREAGYETFYQYRQALGAERGISPTVSRGHARLEETRLSLSPRARQARRANALHAIADTRREGDLLPLDSAAARYGLTSGEVRELLPGAFNGTGELKASDRLARRVTIVSNNGPEKVTVQSSRQASLAGAYMHAVRLALETGDGRDLTKFRGLRIAGFELETDLEVLADMAEAGYLDGVTFYWELAG